MESIHSNPESINDKKIKVLVKDALDFAERVYELTFNEFEKMRIWSVARTVVEENAEKERRLNEAMPNGDRNDDEYQDAVWKLDFLGSKEILSRFFIQEYGVLPIELAKDEFHMGVAPDVIKKLKFLQNKRRTEGYELE